MITWVDNNNVLTTSTIQVDTFRTTTEVIASDVGWTANFNYLSPAVSATALAISYLSDSDHLEPIEYYFSTITTTAVTDNFPVTTWTGTTGIATYHVASQTASGDVRAYKVYGTNGFVVKNGPATGYIDSNESWTTSSEFIPSKVTLSHWWYVYSTSFYFYYDQDVPYDNTTILTFPQPYIYSELTQTGTTTGAYLNNAHIQDGIYPAHQTGPYDKKGGHIWCLLHTSYQGLQSTFTYESIIPTIYPGTGDPISVTAQKITEYAFDDVYSTTKPGDGWFSNHTDVNTVPSYFFGYLITEETTTGFQFNTNAGSPQYWNGGIKIPRDTIDSNWIFYNSSSSTRVADFALPMQNSGLGNMDAIPMASYKNGYAFAPASFSEISIFDLIIVINEHSVKIDGCNISWTTTAGSTTTTTSSIIETANTITFQHTTQDAGYNGQILCLLDKATATFTYQGQVGMKRYNGSHSTTSFIMGETDISPPINNYPTSTTYIHLDKNDFVVIGNEGFFYVPDNYTGIIEKNTGITQGYLGVNPILTFAQ